METAIANHKSFSRNSRGDKGRLTAATRNAMFAEWAKLSPNLTAPSEDMTERELRIWWTNQALAQKAGDLDIAATVRTWSDLTEAQGRYLLKRMREESGDGPAYRARLIARLAQELFGAAWDRLIIDRLAARFHAYRMDELTPRQAHEFIEELVSRIARRDGVSIEEVRTRLRNKL